MSMDQEKNSSEFRNSALLAIMQNVSMSVGPEDELRRLHAENSTLRAGYDAAAAAAAASVATESPQFPDHPEPMCMDWSRLEICAIAQYGREMYAAGKRAALAAPAQAVAPAKINRYCLAKMCLSTDPEHEPNCSSAASKSESAGGHWGPLRDADADHGKQLQVYASKESEAPTDAEIFALVAAAEREAVASMVERGAPPLQDHGNRVEIGYAARKSYAAAIRAMGKP